MVLNEYNKLKDSLSEKDLVLNQLREKRDGVIKKASALRLAISLPLLCGPRKSQEVDLVNEMEVKTRTLRELHGRIAGWSKKLQVRPLGSCSGVFSTSEKA